MKILQNRNQMVDWLVNSNSVCVELGVLKGDFAAQILSKNPKELHLVDIWTGKYTSGDHNGWNAAVYDNDQLYQYVQKRFAENTNVSIHKMNSLDFLSNYQNYFDFLYLDTMHYEETFDELVAVHNACKYGGYICGHDFAVNDDIGPVASFDFLVESAVHKFCHHYNYKLHALAFDGCISFAIKKHSQKQLHKIEML